MRIGVIVVSLLTVLGALLFWSVQHRGPVPQPATAVVTREAITSVVPATGIVVSRTHIDISAPLAGRIVAVLAAEGERVAAGQLLARLDDRETRAMVNKAEATLSLRRRELALAESTLLRLTQIAEQGFISVQKLDDARTEVKVRQAQVDVAAADLALVRTRLDDLAIRAPASGLIAVSNAHIGEWTGRIDASAIFNPKVLFRIIDPEAVFIRARVDENDLADIALGQQVLIENESEPDQSFDGLVIAISPVIQEESGRHIGIVHVELPKTLRKIVVGGQSDLRIVTARRNDALTLPYGAITRASGHTEVIAFRNGTYTRVPVRIGIESLNQVEVIGDVSEGEVVLLQPAASAASNVVTH